MEKQEADKIIHCFLKKLFGFSLAKLNDISKAEELASRITLEVYESLLKNDHIENINGYIYKISQNVYARFVDEEIKCAHLSLDEVSISTFDEPAEDFSESETYKTLRREIAYLSKIQREIVVLHYFDKMKLNNISEKLKIPVGTVKWHLFEAKNKLKEGVNIMRETGTLGIKPIIFNGMGHSGHPGKMGDTSDFLKKRLTQNIAYAAYHEAKTINEIAEELAVSPIFVEDEVSILEEYGFMDMVAGKKFLTNIFISEHSAQSIEEMNILYNKYAKILCEKYVPLVIESIKKYEKEKIYVPDNDLNLLLWAGISFACDYKLKMNKSINDSDRFSVKRPDGGDYIAFASVFSEHKVSFDSSKYNACGNMNRGSNKNYPICSWQLNTFYDGRQGGWRDNLCTDYDYLYEFISGELKKEDSQIEKFKRLYDKGYLRDDDTINLIVVNDGTDNNFLSGSFANALPSITEELKQISDEFDAEMQKITMPLYPKHMKELCKSWTINCLCHNDTRTRVLEQLLQAGMLTLPDENQKLGLNTIMFSDRLPN